MFVVAGVFAAFVLMPMQAFAVGVAALLFAATSRRSPVTATRSTRSQSSARNSRWNQRTASRQVRPRKAPRSADHRLCAGSLSDGRWTHGSQSY
jgi:hypothetical protein